MIHTLSDTALQNKVAYCDTRTIPATQTIATFVSG